MHATYIDRNVLNVTKYSFRIHFLYSARAMTQMELCNSRAMPRFRRGWVSSRPWHLCSTTTYHAENGRYRMFFIAILSKKGGIKQQKNNNSHDKGL